MKTLEQLQDSAGELWPDIDAHLSHLRDHIETLVREEGTNLATLRDQHAAAMAALEDQHAGDRAKAATDQAAAVTAAKLAIQVNLDGIVAEAEPHFAAVMAAYPDDANVIGLGMALAKAKGHTSAARRAKIEADLAAAQAAAADAAAKLAALA